MKHIPAEAQVLVFLTGSKVGLGTPWRRIRDLFGPPLGLESCWGFAVSHDVLGALKFKPTEAEAASHLPSTARLTFSSSGCRFACVAEALVLVFLNGSKVG